MCCARKEHGPDEEGRRRRRAGSGDRPAEGVSRRIRWPRRPGRWSERDRTARQTVSRRAPGSERAGVILVARRPHGVPGTAPPPAPFDAWKVPTGAVASRPLCSPDQRLRVQALVGDEQSHLRRALALLPDLQPRAGRRHARTGSVRGAFPPAPIVLPFYPPYVLDVRATGTPRRGSPQVRSRLSGWVRRPARAASAPQ